MLTRILFVCLFALSLIFIFLPGAGWTKPDASVKFVTLGETKSSLEKEHLVLPYAFPSESMGTTMGMGMGFKGYGQSQLQFGGTVFGSEDKALGCIAALFDYNVPGFNRLFFSFMGSWGHYPRQRAYTQLIRTGDDADAGGNDSSPENYIEDGGNDNWFELKLEYILPIGSMRNSSTVTYGVRDGLMVSGNTGGDIWNPLMSGVTVFMIKQFNRYQSYETSNGGLEGTIHPVKLGLLHNNTNFFPNPDKGSTQFLGFTFDNLWDDSRRYWNFIELEISKYFGLGKSRFARQRVMAFNVWTGDNLSYEKTRDLNGAPVVKNNAPFLAGARLGGFYRMRAFPTNRFNDRSVIYTTMEYRYTLKWNPVDGIDMLSFLDMDWLQMVGFFEGGRVAAAYHLSELCSHWKLDAGFGLRAMMAGAVVRFDVAVSDESTSGWCMFAHPF